MLSQLVFSFDYSHSYSQGIDRKLSRDTTSTRFIAPSLHIWRVKNTFSFPLPLTNFLVSFLAPYLEWKKSTHFFPETKFLLNMLQLLYCDRCIPRMKIGLDFQQVRNKDLFCMPKEHKYLCVYSWCIFVLSIVWKTFTGFPTLLPHLPLLC